MRMKRKGQEEMVGFIMIVVVVIVVLLIFLGFGLRNRDSGFRESAEVSQFLQSSMEFTTDCAVGYIPAYARLGELFKECYRGSLCVGEKSSCETLNYTLEAIVGNSFRIGEEFPLKGYEFRSIYSMNSSATEEILFLSEGNCSSNRIGSEYLIPSSPGVIVNKLELCY